MKVSAIITAAIMGGAGHPQLLSDSIPLSMLEQRIHRWIAGEKAHPA